MTEVVHRMQCAAITRGCTSALVWTDRSKDLDEKARELLALNGWHEDHGRWVCGDHPIRPFRIVTSDAVPPDTAFVVSPSPVDDPDHPDYVPIERRAAMIQLDPGEPR